MHFSKTNFLLKQLIILSQKVTFWWLKTRHLIRRSFRTSFLKDRLTQSGLSSLWKPWTFGDNVSCTLFIVTHASIVTSGIPHFFTKMLFLFFQSVPLPSKLLNSSLRYEILVPIYFRSKDARRLSCYALSQGWLPPSLPLRCNCIITSFIT